MRAKYRDYGYRTIKTDKEGGYYHGIGESKCTGQYGFLSTILSTICDPIDIGWNGTELVHECAWLTNEVVGDFLLLLGLDYMRAQGIKPDYSQSLSLIHI